MNNGVAGTNGGQPYAPSAGASENANMDKVPIAPSRNDVCEIFISGFIGNTPKEAYLSNGHFVLNFAVRRSHMDIRTAL